VALRTVTVCQDILNDRDEVIAVYLLFMAYFFVYDIVAMYQDFLCRCREVGKYEGVIGKSLFTNITLFLRNEILLSFHHIALSTCIPIVLYVWSGRGAYLVGAFLLAEISTPFYTIRNILKTVGYDSGLLYITNGLLFIITFFIGRILMTPFLFYKYCDYKNISLMEVPHSLPWCCTAGSVASILLNSYWFVMIVRTVYYKVGKQRTE